jgi:hypothetical protein
MQWHFIPEYAIAYYGFRLMEHPAFYTVVPDALLFCRVLSTDAANKKNLEYMDMLTDK